MQNLREFGNALVIALMSLGLLLGALSISLVEFIPAPAATPTGEIFQTPIPLTATETLPPTETRATPEIETPAGTAPVEFTGTVVVMGICPAPPTWQLITVQPADTLDSIALRYKTTTAELQNGNCLYSPILVPGSQLRVPPGPTSTVAACIPGAAGWSYSYIVQPGDGLYRIALNHYTTLDLLKKVNCRFSDTIYPGERLWVPNVAATRTAMPTPQPGQTIIVQPTLPLTETALPFTATYLPTNTAVPVTQTPMPTITP